MLSPVPPRKTYTYINRIVRIFSPVLILLAAACSNGVTGDPVGMKSDLTVAAKDRMITVEATTLAKKIRSGQHDWRVVRDAGAVGGRALQAVPDINKAFSPKAGPRADYRVTFPAAGTYYVWVRGSGAPNDVRNSDSLHVGLNGGSQAGAANISGFTDELGWSNKTMRGRRAVLRVQRAGRYTLNVWMREDGFKFDALVLTKDATANPAVVTAPVVAPEVPEPVIEAGSSKLSWSPPRLSNPRVIRVTATSNQNVIKLDLKTDYVIEMPKEPVTRGLAFVGGRNVVLIGGEIAIPWQGSDASIASRTGLKIKSATGTVHVEGLLIRGDDLSEGIQIDAPKAVVQLQNVGIFDVHARDQLNFSDNHPDLIQTYGNVKELRIDCFTGVTDYQGFFFSADYNGAHGPVELRRVNLIGAPTARQLLWLRPQAAAGSVTLDRVYLDSSRTRKRNIGEAVYPNIWNAGPNRAQMANGSVTWPLMMQPRVSGAADSGRPPEGDFVSPKDVGTGYRSPGYW